MLVLLIVCGAVVVFTAGWVMGRTLADPGDIEPTGPAEQRAIDTFSTDVLELHPTGVVVAGPTGAIEYRNSAASELGGTHMGVLVDEAVVRHLAAARAGTPSGETLDLYGPPRRVIVVSSQPLPHGRAAAFIDDISARRRADQARTDFVANVSHELRTPIGALMVLAETIAGEDDPDVIARIVGRMTAEADRAARTIDDLLELSQIESGAERDFGPVRLRDVVDDAVGRAGELAASRDITISTLDTVDQVDDPTTVNGDRPQLASAVGNLVENAVKYSNPGDVVQVRVRGDADHGEIAVIDTGVGIPQRDLDRVFERFYRVDRARNRATGGTGLGLSIVRHVAEHHDGTITVDSIEGEGSTFRLRLPLLDSEQVARDPMPRHEDLHEGVV